MIAIAPKETRTAQFSYLKPCKPEDSRVASDYALPRAKPRRWLGVLAGVLSGCAIASSFWLAARPTESKKVDWRRDAQPASLWEQLGSEEYARFEARYQQQKQRQALAAAREAEQAAQAMRSEAAREVAEAQATREAAENYRTVASYFGADKIHTYSEGEPVLATELVQVECLQGLVGYTADVSGASGSGRVSNLASCNSGAIDAGEAIGIAGEEQVAIIND